MIIFDDLERCGISNKQDLLGAINNFVENKQIKVIVIADEEKIGGEEYKKYKEKLISRTIHMSNDYNSLIENIVEKVHKRTKGYGAFLIDNIDLLKQVFMESKSNNVRTIKCIIADFERVYATWKESDVPMENMKWVLYTFSAEEFISKNPRKNENSLPKKEKYLYTDEKDEQFVDIGKYKSNLFWNLER